MQEVRFLIERVEKDEKDVSQGAWFSLPLNHEEVAEKLDIHSNIEDEEFDVVEAEGIPYDYVCGYCTISEMNELYDKWMEIPFILQVILNFSWNTLTVLMICMRNILGCGCT